MEWTPCDTHSCNEMLKGVLGLFAIVMAAVCQLINGRANQDDYCYDYDGDCYLLLWWTKRASERESERKRMVYSPGQGWWRDDIKRNLIAGAWQVKRRGDEEPLNGIKVTKLLLILWLFWLISDWSILDLMAAALRLFSSLVISFIAGRLFCSHRTIVYGFLNEFQRFAAWFMESEGRQVAEAMI